MALDLSSLQKAIELLDNSINSCFDNQYNESLNKNDKETLKSGVIQKFEVAYELCWKFMKRWLENNVSGESVDGITRKELFRLSAESRLINDVEAWFKYNEERNKTTHTYDGEKAETVYEAAICFAKDARILLQRLEAKND